MRRPRGSRECGKEKEAFPGSPVVRSPDFHCREHGFNPCWGTKIPHGAQSAAKRKKGKKKREKEHVFRRRRGDVRGDPCLCEEGAGRVEMEQPTDRP